MSVSVEDIEAAAKRIAPAVVPTPLLHSDALDAETGARVFVKAESLQRLGSFKMRGAYNKIAALEPTVRARGVIAFSSGNHGIAVAGAARDFGVRAAIVAPADAPAVKIETMRALGAEVIAYDRLRENREEIGARLAHDRGGALVKPFDDPFIIAGQGTIGLEIAEEVGADIVMTPASGGGLASGIAVALASASPRTQVFAVEPVGHDDIGRSLAMGSMQTNEPGVRSICDALLVERPGEITFALLRQHRVGALCVTDAEVRAAVRFAFRHLKLVLEPSGAAAFAASLAGKADVAGKTVVVVASGGNVDGRLFAEIVG